jgi:hypothetical protein
MPQTPMSVAQQAQSARGVKQPCDLVTRTRPKILDDAEANDLPTEQSSYYVNEPNGLKEESEKSKSKSTIRYPLMVRIESEKFNSVTQDVIITSF